MSASGAFSHRSITHTSINLLAALRRLRKQSMFLFRCMFPTSSHKTKRCAHIVIQTKINKPTIWYISPSTPVSPHQLFYNVMAPTFSFCERPSIDRMPVLFGGTLKHVHAEPGYFSMSEHLQQLLHPNYGRWRSLPIGLAKKHYKLCAVFFHITIMADCLFYAVAEHMESKEVVSYLGRIFPTNYNVFEHTLRCCSPYRTFADINRYVCIYTIPQNGITHP